VACYARLPLRSASSFLLLSFTPPARHSGVLHQVTAFRLCLSFTGCAPGVPPPLYQVRLNFFAFSTGSPELPDILFLFGTFFDYFVSSQRPFPLFRPLLGDTCSPFEYFPPMSSTRLFPHFLVSFTTSFFSNCSFLSLARTSLSKAMIFSSPILCWPRSSFLRPRCSESSRVAWLHFRFCSSTPALVSYRMQLVDAPPIGPRPLHH